MENFEIVEDKTLELTFIVKDESHGICNALRHILMQDPDVEYAVYNIDHPLTGKPEMTIKTKRGKRPRNVLKKAAEELQKESSEFKKLIDEAVWRTQASEGPSQGLHSTLRDRVQPWRSWAPGWAVRATCPLSCPPRGRCFRASAECLL